MSRLLPPRLYLRYKHSVPRYWAILHRGKEYGLNLREDQREEAEQALKSYLARGAVWRRAIKGHRRANDTGEGTIYFLRMVMPAGECPIKIGFSNQAQLRFHQIRTASPWPIELLATVTSHQNNEVAIQERCASARLRGEWFKPEPIVLEALAAAEANSILEWLSAA